MTREHITGFLALVENAMGGIVPPIPVYDALVPDSAAAPYVIVESDLGWPESQSIAAVSDWQQIHPRIKAVGRTPREAQDLAEVARAAVLDQRPTVPGRACGPVRLEASMTVTADRAVPSDVRWFTSDQYAVSSTPAPA